MAVSPAWRHLDLLAFETLPRLDEASAIRKALARLYSHTACPRKAAYASFVFPDGQRLPYPHKDAHVKEDMIALIKATLGQGQGAAFDGIGINCTKPRFLSSLVRQMSDAVDSVAASLPPSRPYLFVSHSQGQQPSRSRLVSLTESVSFSALPRRWSGVGWHCQGMEGNTLG